MWFKNLQVYKLPSPWAFSADQLEQALSGNAFSPSDSNELLKQGWDKPRPNGGLVHVVNKQMLILLGTEKKLLPNSVVNQVAKARAAEMEEAQGFAPGKKAMKELKERVADELLPRAFALRSNIWTWIDPVNGWLVVDAASPAKADEVVKHLLKAVDRLPLESLRVKRSPVGVMTEWLQTNESPSGFTVDMDTELRATGHSKAAVRYVKHSLEPDEVRRHIGNGKQCTRLAMTWDSKISFVLTESLAIKGVKALDVLSEKDAGVRNDDERFDGDFMLMTGEISKMLADIVEALGGLADADFDEGRTRNAPIASDATSAIQGISLSTVAVPNSQALAVASTGAQDPLYEQAVRIVLTNRRASVSLVQRHLRIGYNRASRLLEMMEQAGILGPALPPTGERAIVAADNTVAV